MRTDLHPLEKTAIVLVLVVIAALSVADYATHGDFTRWLTNDFAAHGF